MHKRGITKLGDCSAVVIAPAPDTRRHVLASQIGPCVYFIRTTDGLIKIGHTKDLAQRRRHLGPGWDRLLAVEPGTYEDEQALHKRFAPFVVRGREWYRPADEILAYINDIRERLGVDPIAA